MNIKCDSCSVTYKIKDTQIKIGKSIKTQCPKCKHIQTTKITEEQHEVTKDFSDDSNLFDLTAEKKAIKESEVKKPPIDSNLFKNEFTLPSIDLEKLKQDRDQIEEFEKSKVEKINIKKFNPNSEEAEKKEAVIKIFYKAKKGNDFIGPYTFNEIINYIKKEQITKEYLFSKAGSDWKTIDAFPELLPYFPSRIKKNSRIGYYFKQFIKLVVFICILGGVAFLTFYLLKNKDRLIEKAIETTQSKNENKNLLNEYIEKWKKDIILSKDNESEIYLKAIELRLSNTEENYIKSVNMFKEVLIKNPEKTEAFHQFIITLTLSTTEIEKKEDLINFMEILKLHEKKYEKENIKEVLLYNAISGLAFKLNLYSDSNSAAFEAYKIKASDYLANYMMGQFYFKTQPVKAADYYKKAFEIEPRFLLANEMLSKSFLTTNNFTEAINYYEKKDDVFSKFVLSKVYLSLGYYQKAIGTLKYLSKIKHDFIEADILLGIVYYQFEKNYNNAFDLFSELEKKEYFKAKTQQKMDILKHLAIILRLTKNYQKSIEYSGKLLQLDANNPAAIFNLGLTYIQLKDYKKVEYYIDLLDKGEFSLNRQKYLLKFEYYFEIKEYERALEAINNLIALEKYNNVYYLLKAEVATLKNDIDLAFASMFELNQTDPDYYIRNHLKLDDFFIGFYQPERLLKFYEGILNSNNEEKDVVLNNLGLIYYQVRKYDKALFYFIKSAELEPRNYSNYLYLSYLYYNTEKYKEVIKTVDKSLVVDENNSLSYLVGIKASLKLNDLDKAKEYYTDLTTKSKVSQFSRLAQAIYYLGTKDESKAKVILKELQEIFQYDYYIKNLLFNLKF